MTDSSDMRHFSRFACVDWSGAKGSRHAGIALAVCEEGMDAPALILPPGKAWSRQGIADWLLAQDDDLLIGFDFSFAPPLIERGCYFPGEDVPVRAKEFWAYVEQICEDEDLGAASLLESTVFDAIGASQVAKASFAGMRLLNLVSKQMSVWPFDSLPVDGPVVVEIYTTIAARAAGVAKGRSKVRDAMELDRALNVLGSAPHAPLTRYSDHATDAIITSAWLRNAARNQAFWTPTHINSVIAATEGWTFGVV
jgi:hypothetical protein